ASGRVSGLRRVALRHRRIVLRGRRRGDVSPGGAPRFRGIVSMSNKVIVITGASSGIGAALARQRASAGDTVVLAARRADKLASVAESCGARALAVPADATVRAEVDRLRDAALDTFGHVDVWVNNAGRGINRGVLDLSDADLDEMFLVNTKAPLYGM